MLYLDICSIVVSGTISFNHFSEGWSMVMSDTSLISCIINVDCFPHVNDMHSMNKKPSCL